jgi:hypothetical protein
MLEQTGDLLSEFEEENAKRFGCVEVAGAPVGSTCACMYDKQNAELGATYWKSFLKINWHLTTKKQV